MGVKEPYPDKSFFGHGNRFREAQNCRDKKTEGFSFFNVAKEW